VSFQYEHKSLNFLGEQGQIPKDKTSPPPKEDNRRITVQNDRDVNMTEHPLLDGIINISVSQVWGTQIGQAT
jgi:hypothetical protein